MLKTADELARDRGRLRRGTGLVLSDVSDEAIGQLLRLVHQQGGDLDIAIQAVLILERPKWLEEIIGPWPPAGAEPPRT